MLKAVIFDMDGVIVDSEPLHAKAAQRVIEACGVQLPLDYFYSFIGSSVKHMFDTIIVEQHLTTSTDTLLALDKKICSQLAKEEPEPPVPGAIALIKRLSEHGLKLAIASSGTPEHIQEVVDTFQLAPYFTCLVSGAALNRPKPAPDVFLEALQLLSVNADEAIIIEDSQNGIRAANAANIASIGFINPHSGNQDLYAAAAATDSLSALTPEYLNQVLDRANGKPLTIGETRRVVIRELTVSDIPDLYQIYQAENVCRYIPPLSSLEEELEKHTAYIKNIYAFYGYGLWGLFTKKENRLIGRAGLQNQLIDGNEELELSYLIAPEFQNQGYAVEVCREIIDFAINELDACRLTAVIAKENTASLKVAKKLSMSAEKELFYQGFDCFLFSLNLKEEKKRLLTAQKVLKNVKPDTRVYSRRYS